MTLISGTLTVEEIYRDRDKFAQLVREVSSPDLGRMGSYHSRYLVNLLTKVCLPGIEVISFTIKDIYDTVRTFVSQLNVI